MNSFNEFKIKKQLINALDELSITEPTPIQKESYSPILSGNDFVGIAQTGTGKTIAYILPILQNLNFSDQPHPRVLILAPTRELVIQIVEQINTLTKYINVRVIGVFGGSNNIKRQKMAVSEGVDIIIGTPRRLYDLSISNILKLKQIKKLVIDEVDIMLDFGYKTQLKNIFELLPSKRQNILFSATMTEYVDKLTSEFLINPLKKTIALSGTPLENIQQECYQIPNFYSKIHLLEHLLKNDADLSKVLIFVATKADADRLYEILSNNNEVSVIHAKKEQNYRTKSIDKFEKGISRILIATDVISRGIDLEKISVVISFNTPLYPENYMHRIGRTGRAGQSGKSILFFNEDEKPLKQGIEKLMNQKIPQLELPSEVEISNQLTVEEEKSPYENLLEEEEECQNSKAISFDENVKKDKPQHVKKNYKRLLKEKYKKPIRRGDKIQNRKKKRK